MYGHCNVSCSYPHCTVHCTTFTLYEVIYSYIVCTVFTTLYILVHCVYLLCLVFFNRDFSVAQTEIRIREKLCKMISNLANFQFFKGQTKKVNHFQNKLSFFSNFFATRFSCWYICGQFKNPCTVFRKIRQEQFSPGMAHAWLTRAMTTFVATFPSTVYCLVRQEFRP